MTDTELEIAQIRLAQSYFDAWFAYRRAALGLPAESDPQADWNTLVNAKMAQGLSRLEAIKAAGKERPDLYEMQLTPKSDYKA